MALSRSFLTIVGAAVLALVALILLSGSPNGKTPTVLAGPCGADPFLFSVVSFSDPGGEGLPDLKAAVPGHKYHAFLHVDTIPAVLPTGKPPVTVEFFPTDFEIFFSLDPEELHGSGDMWLTIDVDESAQSGPHDFTITVTCHEQTTDYPFTVWVNSCPAGQLAQNWGGVQGVTPTPDYDWNPDACATATETPTPTAAPSDTSTPTPTPTQTDPGGQNVIWGDWNCSDMADPVDALLNLRHDAGLSTNTGDCPDMGTEQSLIASAGLLWGDADCSGAADPIDALKLLRYDAGLSVTQGDNCPALGDQIVLAFG